MRIGRGELGARALLSLSAALAALAVWSCSVEAPPPSTSPPRLGALAPEDAGGCSEPPSFCLGLEPDQCCRNLADCKFTSCGQDSQVCKNDVCEVRPRSCKVASDCLDDAGANADNLICKNGSCIPTDCSGDSDCGPGQQCVSGACLCTSNLGCDGDAGLVCQMEKDAGAGLCVQAIEEEAEPGCSASGAGGSRGVLLALFSALTLAGARARRRVSRRRPQATQKE